MLFEADMINHIPVSGKEQIVVLEWVIPENKCITQPLEEDGTYDFSVVPSKFTWMIVSSATLPNSLCFTHFVCPLHRVFEWWGVGWWASRRSNDKHAGDPPLQISRWVHDYHSRDHRWLAIWRDRQRCWSQRGLPEQPTKHRSMGMFTFR